MKLAELERYFAAAATSGQGPLAGLEQVFCGSDRLPARERLAIYNRAYFYRLLDALASVFAECKRTLGAREFERLGLAYLAAYPSEHPALERVGRYFPQYLARLAVPPPAPVVDLAALEWARLCALVAPDPARLAQANAVDTVTFPSSRLSFVPALRWLELGSRALDAFAGAAEPWQGTDTRLAVAVWRAGHHVRHERLESVEFQALGTASSGGAMAAVCAHFDTGDEQADSQRAFQVIASWFARQWVERIE